MNVKSPVRMTLLAATLAASFQAIAADPAVVFDMGGKFDKSFNEAAYNGAERFKKESGIAFREFEVTAEAQREQALRNSRGDTAQRVMAAMMVADQYGGDGRCSCGHGSLGD